MFVSIYVMYVMYVMYGMSCYVVVQFLYVYVYIYVYVMSCYAVMCYAMFCYAQCYVCYVMLCLCVRACLSGEHGAYPWLYPKRSSVGSEISQVRAMDSSLSVPSALDLGSLQTQD